MKYQLTQSKEEYNNNKNKKGSVSFEMVMTIGDGSEVNPCVQMFTIDEYKEINIAEIENIIAVNSKFISRKLLGRLKSQIGWDAKSDSSQSD